MNSKLGLSALLLILFLVCSFSLNHVDGQTGTNVEGVLSHDTTWTQTGSPYRFTDNMAVNQGVTLTIEAGVVVNFNSYYLQVNGTLKASGKANSQITFNNAQILITALSNGWNEQTKTGCVIQNAVINQADNTNYRAIYGNNPIKIEGCTIKGQITVNSSIVTNNKVTGSIYCYSGLPTFGEDNYPLDLSTVSGNTVTGSISVGGISLGVGSAPSDASLVFNNTVEGSINVGSAQAVPQVFNNTVTRQTRVIAGTTVIVDGGIHCTGYASVFNNHIYGCEQGITLVTQRVFGGNFPCYATVENNLITDNSEGISISLTDVNGGAYLNYSKTNTPTIKNNTISGNEVGILLSGFGYNSTAAIKYNNLLNSANYSFRLQEPNNVDLSYNWWGTTDQQAISQSIYDSKNDPSLGAVTFTPFLTEPNTQALSTIQPATPPTPTSPAPTPIDTSMATPTATPNATPQTPPTTVIAVVVTIVVLCVAGVLVFFKRRKHQS